MKKELDPRVTKKFPILWVDDVPEVYNSFRRSLSYQFNIVGVNSAEAGLRQMARGTPFSIIVSDFMMPGMNGLEFLKEVKKRSPNSIRIMVTGNHDITVKEFSASAAETFKHLQKPISVEEVERVLHSAIQTFQSSVEFEDENDESRLQSKVCVSFAQNVLEILAPELVSDNRKIDQLIQALDSQCNFRSKERLIVSNHLSHIGVVGMHSNLIVKLQAKLELSSEEIRFYDRIPLTSCRMLRDIKELEAIRYIIMHIPFRFDRTDDSMMDASSPELPLESRVLKILKDFVYFFPDNEKYEDRFRALECNSGRYDCDLLNELRRILLNH